jgi:hypothetical protein
MSDLSDIQAAQQVKLIGQDSNGIEQVPVESKTDGSGKGRLLVDANLSGEIVPTISNKLRIRTNVGDITLPGTLAYVTLYTRSGSGLFFGFQAGFDNSSVNVRLTIDGGQVFTLSLDDIRQFQFNDTTTTRCQAGAFLTTIGNVLDFSSRFAIPYATSVLLEAASSTGSAKKNKNWIVIQTEDT